MPLPTNPTRAQLAAAIAQNTPRAGAGLRQSGAVLFAASRGVPLGTTLLYLTGITKWTTDGSTGAMLGGGYYAARVVLPPDAAVDVTVDLTKDAVGNTSGGATVYAENPMEVGQPSSHSLPYNTSTSFALATPVITDGSASSNGASGLVVYSITDAAASNPFPVLLTVDGTTGSGQHTYTLKRLDGTEIAYNVPLITQRPFGDGEVPVSAAKRGFAVYNPRGGDSTGGSGVGNGFPYMGSGSGGSGSGAMTQPYELWWCDEVYGTIDPCSTAGSGSGSGS